MTDEAAALRRGAYWQHVVLSKVAHPGQAHGRHRDGDQRHRGGSGPARAGLINPGPVRGLDRGRLADLTKRGSP
jgi:hypothetical protein